jgi:hypothetical protein
MGGAGATGKLVPSSGEMANIAAVVSTLDIATTLTRSTPGLSAAQLPDPAVILYARPGAPAESAWVIEDGVVA